MTKFKIGDLVKQTYCKQWMSIDIYDNTLGIITKIKNKELVKIYWVDDNFRMYIKTREDSGNWNIKYLTKVN